MIFRKLIIISLLASSISACGKQSESIPDQHTYSEASSCMAISGVVSDSTSAPTDDPKILKIKEFTRQVHENSMMTAIEKGKDKNLTPSEISAQVYQEMQLYSADRAGTFSLMRRKCLSFASPELQTVFAYK